jgi:hypothetical protein
VDGLSKNEDSRLALPLLHLGVADQVIQLPHDLLPRLLTVHVVLDGLIGEDQLEALLYWCEMLDVGDESVWSFGAGVPVDSEYLGEEAGLSFFLPDCAVVVVDLVLVDADDALLLHSHVVHLYDGELFVERSLAETDG